jgi:Cu-Zn family superoxide dismutase
MNCINAIAIFNNSNIKGEILFHQCYNKKGVSVYIDLYDLEPNKTRAIHIHEYGDETNGCKSLGGHWNPYNTTHGSRKYNMKRHAGDLINNFTTNSEGRYKYQYVDELLNLRGNINESIIGRSVVVHEGIDDLGLGNNIESLKTGNAGKRMACAIIGRGKDGKF